MWGEWLYDGMPVLGDYVQIECRCGHVAEGIVVYVDTVSVRLHNESESGPSRYARRWRRRILPESQIRETTREVETV